MANNWLMRSVGKVLIFTMLLTTGMLFEPYGKAYAEDGIKISANGKVCTFEQGPMLVNDRTLVPMHAVAEVLGAAVSWDQHASAVSAVKGRNQVTLQIGNTVAKVNERDVQVDSPAILHNGKVMVPLRFISEELGAEVEWVGESRTVNILTQAKSTGKEHYAEDILKGQYSVSAVTTSVPAQDETLKPENMIDGDLSTVWGSGKLGTEITFDLGSEKKVNYIAIVWSGGALRRQKFDIMGSKDGKNFEKIAAMQSSGKTEEPEIYEVEEQSLRYMKVICNGSDAGNWFNILEAAIGYKDKGAVVISKPAFPHLFQQDIPRYTSFVEKDGMVSIEAENYSYHEGYEVFSNPNVSGGKYVQIQEALEDKQGTLRFDFTVETGGRWYLWMRTFSPAAEDNGMFIYLDGKLIKAPQDHIYAGVEDIYLKKSIWQWEPEWNEAGSGIHAGPVTIDMDPGEHTLRIAKRKGERPWIDKIVLTKESGRPWKNAFGPAETISHISDAADPNKGALRATIENQYDIAGITTSEPAKNERLKPENMIDGDLSTIWGSGTLGIAITLDLGSEKDVNYVAIAWSKGDQKKHMFDVMGSKDGENYEKIASLESSGTTENLEIYPFEEQCLRYLKIIGNGNNAEKASNWSNILDIAVGKGDVERSR